MWLRKLIAFFRGLNINCAPRKSKGASSRAQSVKRVLGLSSKAFLFKSSTNTSGPGNALANVH